MTTDDGIHVFEAFRPTRPNLVNNPDARAAANYLAVAAQFDVVNNPRYAPGHAGHEETYCNIFVWDVTAAMRAEVPHWADMEGNPVPMGKGVELSANHVCDWLFEEKGGYKEIPEDEAVAAAGRGCPTVAAWKNPVGDGHVAMVIPSQYIGTRTAQAGKTNFFDGVYTKGFGGRLVRFFTHD